MSHTTTLRGLAIRDERAIRQATEELAAQGVDIRLEANAKPRMYYTRQEEQCDFVLRLDKARGGSRTFDVGLKKEADGTYKVIMDEWLGGVASQIGTTCAIPKTAEEKALSSIGRWSQIYAKHTAINAATAQGYMVESTTMDEEGNVHLSLIA